MGKARWTVAFFLLLAILGGFYATEFELDASADSMVLEDDEDLDEYRAMRQAFPAGDDFLVVVYKPRADLFSEASLANLKRLHERLAAVDQVKKVTSMMNVPLLNKPGISLGNVDDYIRYYDQDDVSANDLKSGIFHNPLYPDLLVDQAGSLTALQVDLKINETYQAAFDEREALKKTHGLNELTQPQQAKLDQLNDVIKSLNAVRIKADRLAIEKIRSILGEFEGEADLHLGGVPMIVVDMLDYVKHDIVVFSGAVVVLIVLILAAIFRHWVWVVFPLLTCSLASWLLVCLLGALEFPVTVISSNFISLLLILTLSMIIHLVIRYQELAKNETNLTTRELIFSMVRQMAQPCLYMTLTTLVAFLSLMVSGIRPVIDFGVIMSMGLVMTYLVAFLFFPALLACMPNLPVTERLSATKNPINAWFASLVESKGTAILMVSLGLSLFAAVGISKLSVENRFIDYFKSNTEIHQGMLLIDEKLGGTTPLDLVIKLAIPDADEESGGDCFLDDDCNENVLAQSSVYSPQLLGQFAQVHAYLSSLPEVGKVLSIASTFQLLEKVKGQPLNGLESALAPKFMSEAIHQLLISPYVNEATGQIRFSVRLKEAQLTLGRQALLTKIKTDLSSQLGFDEANIQLTGMAVLYNNMLQSLFKSQIITLGAVLMLVALMFAVLFRSVYLGCIALIPNLLSAALIISGMGWLGIPLDIMTITIAAISVGMGVDHTIHYLYRFRDELSKDGDYLAAMHRSHQSIGRAMYYTSMTVALGFSVLMLSQFKPTVYFGLLTGLAIGIALIASLTLLPKLVIKLKPFG